ncbi:MAG TPA: flavin reductase [Methylomusa anaerophila]|uniref:High molecular weight rubredoxin n=1 Tax=Methylomusa anaerophila TaxID=1930071 RepID=A0A348AM49_9FIRM|nr:flavin reductase [Methylomusa anaerophila]BBB92147.1 high molecular weight rubredoxin [Methylomusa anaerophila]HML87839.1 flavin reductase [Methylomusa anaerophila]
MSKWRCNVCGYVYEGEKPPAECPICGVGPEEFSSVGETTVATARPIPAKRWKCTVCDYVHVGETPPDVCPLCGAGSDAFVLLSDDAQSLTAEAIAAAGLGTARSALNKVSYGLYIITSVNAGQLNGQCCNTAFQLTDQPTRLAVCLNKENLTHEYIMASAVFAISMLSTNQLDMVRHFGYQSGRNVNKFKDIEYIAGKNGCPILKNGVAYVEGTILPEKSVDVGTHTLFIGDVTAGRMIVDEDPLTYHLYRENRAK